MIYASTNCLKNPKNVIKVLEIYEKSGIENVELGSVHSYFDIKLLKNFSFNFLIHNYFPPPKKPFTFNLASQKKLIRTKSISLAKKAIDLCCTLESPLYTFHPGFTVDPPDIGKPFPKTNIADRKKSLFTYVESVEEISRYANERGIKIAMEPSVVQKFNLIDGRNELLLFADYPEIKLFFKYLHRTDVGLLLDLGHATVSAYWLNYDKDDFVKKCKKRVSAIHVSNNNGLQDQHKSLTPNCWQILKLKEFKHVPIILETMNLTVEQIKSNINLVSQKIHDT
ncbi:hypothetical protein C5F47_00735 [Nitrosopumilus cobalaminigenes]|uniref:Xylose isomerase-like TIM barrel domain-containing protein n=1 Tax=Nitrosopumilus cobalaminigenes TaxID=1470066 RepID=A0A7D5M1E2_9ARCH|nr:DUF692 family multinuclear iron-containing protein [Nitrosopumilus cobalaminigenes]QLH02208.1 hypothetical protein C5F47_00735 [Nitrosopumilus cobalaminigenes]